ncbi:MAG: peroxiredoxin Q/BCP [Cellvibrionaceae bacterium]|jgi:peroxiredoxin Q/BCP
MALPEVGSIAPTFSLKNQNDELIDLEDYRGKKNIVLYFYPKASTPGCTTQACGIRDIQLLLLEKDTVIFGVSPDPVGKLQKFIDKQNLNFDLLSDEDHSVAEKYGVWDMKKFMGKEFMGILRTTFIIDKSSHLVAILDKFKTSNHHDELLKKLDEVIEN